MTKQYAILIIVLLMLLSACNVEKEDNVSYRHDDKFSKITVDNTDTVYETSDKVFTEEDDIDFELKDNTVTEYTQQELDKIESTYMNEAVPNYIIDDTQSENDKADYLTEKQVEIDGEIYTIYVTE